jgi:hypothetical protein
MGDEVVVEVSACYRPLKQALREVGNCLLGRKESGRPHSFTSPLGGSLTYRHARIKMPVDGGAKVGLQSSRLCISFIIRPFCNYFIVFQLSFKD